MHNRNMALTVLVLVLLIAGGYWLFSATPADTTTTTPPVATTTSPTANVTVDTAPDVVPVPATSASAPDVQTGILTAPTNATAVVTGYVAPNGSATSYWYDYGTNNTLASRTASKQVGSGFVTLATPEFLSGLAPSTTYFYRLSAENALGTKQGTMHSFTTSANPPPAGSVPVVTTGGSLTVTNSGATLNGSVTPNNSQTTYWFEYGQTQSFGSVTAFEAAGNGTASVALSATLSGLAPHTKYYYRLIGQNAYGVVVGATQNFTTIGSAAAGLPTVTTTPAMKVGTSSATLAGRINPHNVASSYWFEYNTNANLAGTVQTVVASQALPAEVATAVTGEAGGLASDTKYYYRAVVRTPAGTVQGDIMSFTTKKR